MTNTNHFLSFLRNTCLSNAEAEQERWLEESEKWSLTWWARLATVGMHREEQRDPQSLWQGLRLSGQQMHALQQEGGQAWEVPASWTAPLCGEVLEAREDALSGVASGDPGSHSQKATWEPPPGWEDANSRHLGDSLCGVHLPNPRFSILGAWGKLYFKKKQH